MEDIISIVINNCTSKPVLGVQPSYTLDGIAKTHGSEHVIASSPFSISLMRSFLLEVLRLVVLPTILGYASCYLWSCYNKGSRDLSCSKPLPPGGFGLPFIGETFQFFFRGTKFFESKRSKYGNVYKTHLLGKPTIRVLGPKNVKQILRGENSLVTTQWPTSTLILLGEGCISHASGESHMTKKKAVMRAFSFRALSGYVPQIQTVIRSYIGKWCSETRVLGYPEFKEMNFDLSCRVMIGIEMNSEERKHLMAVFESFVSNLFCIPVNIPGSGLRKGLSAQKILLKRIEDHITGRISSGEGEDCQSDVLCQMMSIAGDERLGISELNNLCLELLFAGHGTTSSASAFLVLQLAKHPDVLEKIRRELDSHGLLEPASSPDLDLQALNKLTYVRNVIKEVLRLSPPVGAGFRKALKTFEVDGYQVPAGWTVMYAIRDTHETTDTFQNADVFNPDRWLHQAASGNGFDYLPFGGGKRACAGKELAMLMLKVFAIELARCCSWRMEKSDSKFKTFPLPCPADGLPLRFTKLPSGTDLKGSSV